MKSIAISGKGGTGKSTIAALLIRWISENISKSILAVDADANVNLNTLLGVEIKETIGAIREEMKNRVNNLPGGMTKQQYLDYKIQSSVVETKHFDLIAMGCPEGPGCYCYANSLLRDIIASLAHNYEFVIVDNEAGMEHLSRRTIQAIDFLMIISDVTVRGVQTAGNISRLAKDLKTIVKQEYLILNRVSNSIPQKVAECIKNEKLKLVASMPEDMELMKIDQEGSAIWPVMTKSAIYQAIESMMRNLAIFHN